MAEWVMPRVRVEMWVWRRGAVTEGTLKSHSLLLRSPFVVRRLSFVMMTLASFVVRRRSLFVLFYSLPSPRLCISRSVGRSVCHIPLLFAVRW